MHCLANMRGLGIFHRTGYREKDVVNYEKNLKGNVGLYTALNLLCQKNHLNWIYGFNIGNGTTVYQGDKPL